MWKAIEQLSIFFLMIMTAAETHRWLTPRGMMFASSLWHQRSLALLQFCRKGQGTEDCLGVLSLACWEPPDRSNMEASGGPCVALAARVRPVFVSGLLDYSYVPEEVILIAPWPAARRTWKHVRSWTGSGLCEEDVIAGSEIFLGRILPVSCSYTFLFVCLLSLRRLQHQLGSINVPLNIL